VEDVLKEVEKQGNGLLVEHSSKWVRRLTRVSSGGEMDYDAEVEDLRADDPHAKSLPKETVDHATASHEKGYRVSIFRSKFPIHNDQIYW
jgi:hypothetical protein